MAVKKFRFVSPGVFINEIDNSQIPASPAGIGPVVIGRAKSGPGLRPITVESFSEFVETFGAPIPGGAGGDVWRDGNNVGPTYGGYGAQAYLRNSSPLTFVRLMGAESPDKTSAGYAGWKINPAQSTSGCGAYGLFIWNSGSQDGNLQATGSLQASHATNTPGEYAIVAFTGSDGHVFRFQWSPSGSDDGVDTQGVAGQHEENAILVSGGVATAAGATALADHFFHELMISMTRSIGTKYVGTSTGAPTTDYPKVFGSCSLGGDLDGTSNGPTTSDGAATHQFVVSSGSVSGPRINVTASISGGLVGYASNTLIQSLNCSNVTFTGLSGGMSNYVSTGALAAILYANSSSTNQSSFALSGTLAGRDDSAVVTGTCAMVESSVASSDYEFKMYIKNYQGSKDLLTSVNFNSESPRYIRKALNTNPQLSNTATSDTVTKYWVGETFDRHLKDTVTAGSSNKYWGALLPLLEAAGGNGASFAMPLLSAQTPWIISQDITTDSGSYDATAMQKLFKLHALNEPGDWTNRNLKISIEDIAAPPNPDADPWGSFSIVVRSLKDSDNVVRVLEQFNDCNLNENSLNYVKRKIGDRRTSWDNTLKRYVTYGEFDNQSRYIRIELANGHGGSTQYLPFGFLGVVKYADVSVNLSGNSPDLGSYIAASGSSFDAASLANTTALPGPSVAGVATGLSGSYLLFGSGTQVNHGLGFRSADFTGSIKFPAPALRKSGSDGGLGNTTDAYFGFNTGRTAGSVRFGESNLDLLMPRGGVLTDQFTSTAAGCELSVPFTLDDLIFTGSLNAAWVSGSRRILSTGGPGAAGASMTAVSSSWEEPLNQGFDRFTVPLHGGFDGLDIRKPEPFDNTALEDSTEFGYYANYSIKRAIDAIADPEVVEMNLATVPGITNEGLTTHLINTCEDRADALAIVDLKGGFKETTENTDSFSGRVGSVTDILNNLKSRGLNSSYGCAYYPWVQVRDTINGKLLWVPPSIPALGTFSSSQRKTEVWFAPAGFNRGGLTEGSAGLPVVNIVEQLTRKQRDDLYAANVNPIAKFPAEGIVIFGQKTLQVTSSALDRINVRRMLIFVKKRISQIATTLLFDPNVQSTWDRFTSQVTPFLDTVKTNFGLTDYKLVLDETTTTADLIDRNIMYAKIYLKPTRAIEFIALDFNITRTGASFVD